MSLLWVLATLALSPVVVGQVDFDPSAIIPASLLPTACAAVSSAIVAAPTNSPYVLPSLAFQCLQSVPVDVEANVELLEFLLPSLQFQGTLGYLKNPPKEYLIPGVDLVGGLVQMRQKLRDGGYLNQYEFTYDLEMLFKAAGDGHLRYKPVLNGVFRVARTLNLSSISPDGLQLPKIYDRDDLLRSQTDGYTASEITAIDGVPVQPYLIEVSRQMAFPDPDAAFNALFSNIPLKRPGFGDMFSSLFVWALPDYDNVTFANMTSALYANRAITEYKRQFASIDSGEKLHAELELDQSPAPDNGTTHMVMVSSNNTKPITPRGYPEPIDHDRRERLAGYFLNDSAHLDTCVLAVKSFAPGPVTLGPKGVKKLPENVEFRNVIRSFFKACKDDGRTKLIIDVSGNPGGRIMGGFELYRNLFPTGPAWSGDRLRATPALNAYGSAM